MQILVGGDVSALPELHTHVINGRIMKGKEDQIEGNYRVQALGYIMEKVAEVTMAHKNISHLQKCFVTTTLKI
ncbi:MAG TPA: hypothetical protein VGF44_14115 [Terriglobales bacterium]